MDRKPEYNYSVDPLDWLTFVFPRFADYYQEAQKERTYSSIDDPLLETYCLINVPQIVWLTQKDDRLIETCPGQ